MKVFSLIALALATSTGAAFASSAPGPTVEAAAAVSQQDAQKYAQDLPQTLVVRTAPTGEITLFHSPTAIPSGQQLPAQSPAMQSLNANRLDASYSIERSRGRQYRAHGVGRAFGGAWNFFWDVLGAASAPTYYYSYPSYHYSYGYRYSPYYSYYDPWGYRYSYYGWRW